MYCQNPECFVPLHTVARDYIDDHENRTLRCCSALCLKKAREAKEQRRLGARMVGGGRPRAVLAGRR